MATIVNAIDVALQATSPRVVPATLPSNINVDFTNVIGSTKPANNATVGATWGTNVNSQPTDLQIMNDKALINANLIAGCLRFIHAGANFTNLSCKTSVDGTSIVIPSGSNFISSLVSLPGLVAYTTYTLSFKAVCFSGTGRTLTVDLTQSYYPATSITLDATLTQYTFQWTMGSSYFTENLRIFADTITCGVEIMDIQLEIGTVRTPWKPNIGDNIGINNQITPANYATYMAAQSVSLMSYSQNASDSSSSLSTTLNFNSDGQNVLVTVMGTLVGKYNSTNGNSYMTMNLTVGGTTYLNITGAKVPNVSDGNPIIISATHQIYVANPGSGSVNYTLTLTVTGSGDGSGGVVHWPTLQLIGLKR